jgi:hypothetical protein
MDSYERVPIFKTLRQMLETHKTNERTASHKQPPFSMPDCWHASMLACQKVNNLKCWPANMLTCRNIRRIFQERIAVLGKISYMKREENLCRLW